MQRENWRRPDVNSTEGSSTNGAVYRIPQRRNPESGENWRDCDDENETPGATRQWKWETKEPYFFLDIDTAKLEKFSNMDSHSISLKISTQKNSFKQLLESELDHDRTVLVLKILAKLCQSSLNTGKTEIIKSAFEGGLPYKLLILVQHLQHKPHGSRRIITFWNDTKGFFSNIAVLYKFLVYTLPSDTYEVLRETLEGIVLNIHSLEFEQGIDVCNETKWKLENLMARLMELTVAVEVKPKRVPQELSTKSSTLEKSFALKNQRKNEKFPLGLSKEDISENKRRSAGEEVLTRHVLPCSHEYLVPGFMDFKDFKCQRPVQAELPCGHVVKDKPCHQCVDEFPCPFPCDTRVEPCGHACVQTCHVNNDPDHVEYKCCKPCARLKKDCLTKDHYCQLLCFEECPPCIVRKPSTTCSHEVIVSCNAEAGTVKCQEMVEKVLPNCGHSVQAKCCEPPSRKNCRGKCPRILNCGHSCQEKCNEPCTTKCTEMIDSTPSACGHMFKIECFRHFSCIAVTQPLNKCQEPCKIVLTCGHLCSGTCSDCAEGRIHANCERKCGRKMICGHKCTESCHEVCGPCTYKCTSKCRHSVCRKTCGEPCASCSEPCTRQCKHVQCKAKCGELCTVGPCTEPCQELLACGHRCVGFCGDACPPLCRICDRKVLTKLFFGNESEDDTTFILLDECGHVFESWGMEQWLDEGNFCCPKCKVQLASTQHYGEYFKKATMDVTAKKRKVFGDYRDNEQRRLELLKELENIRLNCDELITYSPSLAKLLGDFKLFLNNFSKDRRQPFHAVLANSYASKVNIVGRIVTTFNARTFKNSGHVKITAEHIEFLLQYLAKQGHRITNQQIQDFESELLRLNRIVQLYETANSVHFQSVVVRNPVLKALFDKAVKTVVSSSVYTQTDNNYVTRQLQIIGKMQADWQTK